MTTEPRSDTAPTTDQSSLERAARSLANWTHEPVDSILERWAATRSSSPYRAARAWAARDPGAMLEQADLDLHQVIGEGGEFNHLGSARFADNVAAYAIGYRKAEQLGAPCPRCREYSARVGTWRVIAALSIVLAIALAWILSRAPVLS